MDITRCRHTFTQERIFNPWKRCSYCLESIPPFGSVRRCTTCDTVVHTHCYKRILEQLHRVAAIMEGTDPGSPLPARPGTQAAAASSTSAVKSDAQPALTTSSAPPSLTGKTARHAMQSYNAFSDYIAAQRAWLTPMMTTSAFPSEEASRAAPAAAAAAGTDANTKAQQEGARSRNAASSPSSWWPAMFSSPAEASCVTPLSAEEEKPPHTHQLEPFTVYVPFQQCAVCARRGTSSQSSTRETVCGQHPHHRDTHEEDGEYAIEMEELSPRTRQATSSSATALATEAVSPGVHKAHYDPVQKLLRDGSLIGLGMSAYHCTSCTDRFALHCDCLRYLPAECYTLRAPAPHRMKGDEDTTADQEDGGESSNSQSRVRGAGGQGAVSASEVANALASKALPGWVKLLLHAYLTASSSKAHGKPGNNLGDNVSDNTERILDSLYAYMGLIIEEFPNLGTQLLNPIRMRQLNRAHEALYDACCDSLPDADIFGGVDTVSPSPPSPPDSLNSATNASVASASMDLQQHPTSLFLRDTLRFAIAVYGECYRDGSLSSLFSSALLFTTNKEDVYNMPKEKNDDAVTDVLTLPRSALKLSRWATYPGEASYALLVDHGSRRIIVTFRGTLSEVDILTDVCAFGEPFCGGVAHQGAARAVNLIFDHRTSRVKSAEAAAAADAKTEKKEETNKTAGSEPAAQTTAENNDIVVNESGEALRTRSTPPEPERESEPATSTTPPPVLGISAPTLRRRAGVAPDDLLDMLEDLAMNKFPTYTVVITGHSLGAGEAILFGVRLVHDQIFPPEVLSKRVHVVAFAAMPTLSLSAATRCDVVRDSGDDDNADVTKARDEGTPKEASSPPPPPLACMWTIVNSCDVVPRLQINSLNRLCALICRTEEEAAVAKDSDAPADTPTGKTATPTSHNAKKSSLDLMTELHHPGRVFVFTNPGDSQRNRLVEVPRGHLMSHEIFLMPAMLTTHLIDNYMDAMRYVRTREKAPLMPSPSLVEDPPNPSAKPLDEETAFEL